MKTTLRTTLLLLVLILCNSLSAQVLNNQLVPNDRMQFGLSFDKNIYAHGSDMHIKTYSFLSAVYQFYFNVPVSSSVNILGDIPYTKTKYTMKSYGSEYSYYDKEGLGNIFLGLQYFPVLQEDFKTSVIFGAFLPTGSDNIYLDDVFTDYTGLQKFIPIDIGIYANYNYLRSKRGMLYGFELGPNLSLPRSGRDDVKLFAHFGLRGGMQKGKFQLNAEYKGVLMDDYDPFVSFLNFEANWRESFLNPGLFFRIYVTGDRDFVYGLTLSVSI